MDSNFLAAIIFIIESLNYASWLEIINRLQERTQ